MDNEKKSLNFSTCFLHLLMAEMLGVEDVSRAGNFEDDVYLKMLCVNLHLVVLPANFFRTAPQISYFTIRYNHKLDLKSKEKITANHFSPDKSSSY